MCADALERVATVDLTAEEAMALLSLCITSIKAIDEPTRSALDKLADYCKLLVLSESEA